MGRKRVNRGVKLVPFSPRLTEDADRRIKNVLWNDPATGAMRHAGAGHEDTLDCARENGLNLPGNLGR